MADPTRVFGFVQFEVAGPLGPAPGRYVVRRYAGDDPQHIIVIAGAAAPARRGWLSGRRARPVEPHPPPATVDLTRATVIDAAGLPHEAAAREWLAGAARRDQASQTVGAALTVLNRAIAGHRLGAADPHVVELDAGAALAIRIGFGAGEEVAEGEWTEAVDAPRPARRSPAVLRPQERLAALLGGRDAALACEELALRARLDLDCGREREAALQLRAAVDAALAEFEAFRELRGVAVRLEALREQAPAGRAAAEAALRAGLDEPAQAAVRATLERLEALLRARLAAAEF